MRFKLDDDENEEEVEIDVDICQFSVQLEAVLDAFLKDKRKTATSQGWFDAEVGSFQDWVDDLAKKEIENDSRKSDSETRTDNTRT